MQLALNVDAEGVPRKLCSLMELSVRAVQQLDIGEFGYHAGHT